MSILPKMTLSTLEAQVDPDRGQNYEHKTKKKHVEMNHILRPNVLKTCNSFSREFVIIIMHLIHGN